MSPLDRILTRARSTHARIALAEGEDDRVIAAAARASAEGIAQPILIGRHDKIIAKLKRLGLPASAVGVIEPNSADAFDRYCGRYVEIRRSKGVSPRTASVAMSDPLNFAAMMVALGDADGSVGGAVRTTADTVRVALQVIGKAENASLVSSSFLLDLRACEGRDARTLVFADCGLVIEPDIGQLAQIAISSADTYRQLLGAEPIVAMLSFSTAGSAEHPCVQRVRNATRLVKAWRPDLTVDGELQFDAAFVPEISASKSQGSVVDGRANVMIFPSLDAANIGYKIAQRIGNATAVGPILQGLRRPANDVSRGSSSDDIFYMIGVTAVQAGAKREAAWTTVGSELSDELS